MQLLRYRMLPYFPAGILKFLLFGVASSDIFFSNALFISRSLYQVAERKHILSDQIQKKRCTYLSNEGSSLRNLSIA